MAGYHVRRQFGGIIIEMRVFNREYSNETPSFDALTIVAPIVRFNERRADEMILRAGPPPLSIQVVQHFAGPAFTGGPNIC